MVTARLLRLLRARLAAPGWRALPGSPLGAQPPPRATRVLVPAASKYTADLTAVDHPGVRVCFGHDATRKRLRRWEVDLSEHGLA